MLPINRPIYFVRGIRNHYPDNARAQDLRVVDFMRGEEVQCMGVMASRKIPFPGNIVALSSHTKVMYINEQGQVEASNTTISGQLFEAILSSTNIGKSMVPVEGEEAGGYTFEELVEVATECVRHCGLARAIMMTRFLQVLMKTNGEERELIVDAAIAADDLNAFRELRDQGYHSDYYLLYGHEIRCKLYAYMLKKEFGDQVVVDCIYDKDELDQLTVTGSIAVALQSIENDRKQ